MNAAVQGHQGQAHSIHELRHPIPLPRWGYVFGGLANVAQIFNLLYRRIVFGNIRESGQPRDGVTDITPFILAPGGRLSFVRGDFQNRRDNHIAVPRIAEHPLPLLPVKTEWTRPQAEHAKPERV